MSTLAPRPLVRVLGRPCLILRALFVSSGTFRLFSSLRYNPLDLVSLFVGLVAVGVASLIHCRRRTAARIAPFSLLYIPPSVSSLFPVSVLMAVGFCVALSMNSGYVGTSLPRASCSLWPPRRTCPHFLLTSLCLQFGGRFCSCSSRPPQPLYFGPFFRAPYTASSCGLEWTLPLRADRLFYLALVGLPLSAGTLMFCPTVNILSTPLFLSHSTDSQNLSRASW